MAADNKKRHIVSYENMSRELAEAFAEKCANFSLREHLFGHK